MSCNTNLNWHIMNKYLCRKILLEVASMFTVLDTVYPLRLQHEFFLSFTSDNFSIDRDDFNMPIVQASMA